MLGKIYQTHEDKCPAMALTYLQSDKTAMIDVQISQL